MVIHIKKGVVLSEINSYYLAMFSSVWKVWKDNNYPGNPVLIATCRGSAGEDTTTIYKTDHLIPKQCVDLFRRVNDELGPDFECTNSAIGLVVEWKPQETK